MNTLAHRPAAASTGHDRVDAARCPLCGQPNDCALSTTPHGDAATPPCWCMHARFTPALLARVPAHARRRACICAACAAAADG